MATRNDSYVVPPAYPPFPPLLSQIIDCTPSQYKANGDGCQGIQLISAGLIFPYARRGLMAAEQYPYQAQQVGCRTPVHGVPYGGSV